MTIEEIEAKFKQLEEGFQAVEEVNEEFDDFIASLQKLVY